VLPTVGWPDELGSFGRATFCEAWAAKKSGRWDSPVMPDPYRPLLDLARLGYRPWLIDAEALVIVER
jgi:hypothetical protein